MTKRGIHSAALTIFLAMGRTNIVSDDEFRWPGSPCVPPTLAKRGRGVTETFPYEAETPAGIHCLACVFQIVPAFLVGTKTEQPNWTPHTREGVVPGPLPADEAVPCERTPHGPARFLTCSEYFQTIVPPWNATQPTQCDFVHANLRFVLADFFPVALRVLLTDHGAGIVTLH